MRLRLIPLVAILALVGCDSGPKLVPVTGTVTMNGKPLEGAMVSFLPDQANPIATTGSDTTGPAGNYKIMTRGRAGLAPGKYKVGISKVETPKGVGSNLPDEIKEDPTQAALATGRTAVPPPPGSKKAKPDASRIEDLRDAEVEAGGSVLDFDVKAASKDAEK